MCTKNQNIYTEVYELYQNKDLQIRKEEYEWYCQQASSLREAIENAFLSKFPNKNGEIKIHPHQRRPANRFPTVFQQAAQKALENFDVQNLSDNDFDCFEEIYYKFVSPVREKITGFGELAHYDVSMRIAKYQELKYKNCGLLNEVYLHAHPLKSTIAIYEVGDLSNTINRSDLREGAKISIDKFPPPLNKLTGEGDHLENLLCIYYNQYFSKM